MNTDPATTATDPEEHKEEGVMASAARALRSFFEPPPEQSTTTTDFDSSSLRDPLLPSSFVTPPSPSPDAPLPPPPTPTEPLPSSADDDDDDDDILFPFIPRGLSWSDDARRTLRELIRRAGNYLAYAVVLLMFILIPQVVYRGVKEGRIDFAAYNSAGVMVLGTVVLSTRLVYLHVTHFYMPEVQKYVVRILCMVPLYAVQSWLSLRFHGSRIYIDTIRDLYEAYVIASFVYYLIELLGGEEGLIHILEGKDDPSLGYHTFPLRLILNPWVLGEDFMLQCKHGVLQYVVFKIVASTLTLLFESLNIYGEGQFHWMVAYPYLVIFQNVSVCYALYCLVMLYSAVDEELRHPINWHPLGKFLCVKGVVFFCWWQGVLIFYLEAHGIITGAGSQWSAQDVANELIEYCIVFEMVLFAIAHSYTFTYKEYLPENLPPEYRTARSPPQQPVRGNNNGTHRHQAAAGHDIPVAHLVVPVDNDNDGQGGNNDLSSTAVTRDDSVVVPVTTLQGMQSDFTVTTHTSVSSSTTRTALVLDRPMGFKNALIHSTVPTETIEDIQRLQVGRELVFALRPRTSSQESETRRALAAAAAAAAEQANEENGQTPPTSTSDTDESAAEAKANEANGERPPPTRDPDPDSSC